MKTFSLTIFLTSWCFLILHAQDVIIKTNLSEIQAKVTEITDEFAKYKKWDNPDGPLYTLSLKEIAKIKYQNGSEEVYNQPIISDEVEYREESVAMADKFDIENENMVKQIEAIAKNAGTIILSRCSFRADNTTTEVYFDGVYKDEFSKELVIPIRVSWQPANISGDKKWIKGIIKVGPSGKKTWQYQSDGGRFVGNCAKTIKDL